MKIENLKAGIGGIAIMIGVFLFMFLAIEKSGDLYRIASGAIQDFRTSDKTASLPAFETTLINPELDIAPKPDNLEEGTFNTSRDGDTIEEENTKETKIFYHYRAIPSKLLDRVELSPTLKLEITHESGLSGWKKATITQFDRENNLVYFLIKTVENDKEIRQDNFTGRYQLIFNPIN